MPSAEAHVQTSSAGDWSSLARCAGAAGVEQLAAGVGEGDEYAAAVAGVGFAADQASFAEVVDPQRHEMNKLGANYIQAGLWEGFADPRRQPRSPASRTSAEPRPPRSSSAPSANSAAHAAAWLSGAGRLGERADHDD